MEIRNDYVGNVAKGKKGKTIHGLKYNLHKENSIFCGSNYNGGIYHRPAVDALSEVGVKHLAEAITCKRCRDILGLSNKSPRKSERPDYYLIIDTSVCSLPSTVTACETTPEIVEHIKSVINSENVDLGVCNTDRFKIVGVKEVEQLHVKIVLKGYEVELHKQ